MPDLPDEHTTAFVQITRREGVLLVRPLGPNVGQREAPIIQREVNPYLAEIGSSLEHLVLDMSTTNFMSSMGLGMCIAFRNMANSVSAESILFGITRNFRGIIATSRIESLYTIANDHADLQRITGLD
tara:strand:+ start:575 stop:958 length:384 start_codon:yes stop_codon:yes gene_type:complete